MKHDYYQITDEIVNQVGISKDEVYYFDGVPLEGIFERCFQFCQENLKIKEKEFDITPARFFFRNDTSINAFATKQNNYFIVGINSGIVVKLYAFFESKNELFDGDELSFLNNLNALLKEIDTPIFHLMHQFCSQFTYYHELAHLIQKSPDLSQGISEQYFNPEKKCEFTPERHVYEFDADLYGSEHTAFHILEFWKKQDAKLKTSENLELLISIGGAAVFGYFLLLLNEYKDIYYAETCHPHPVIRISYIIDSFIQTIEGNLKGEVSLNSNNAVQNSFRIIDAIYKSEGSNKVDTFVDIFKREMKNIDSYIRNNIFSLIPKMTDLVYNRVRA